jgi:gliding motility-associated-like protein
MKSKALHILLIFFFYLPTVFGQSVKHTYRFYKDFNVAQPECGPSLTQAKAPGQCATSNTAGTFIEDLLPCGSRRLVYHINRNWGLMYPNSDGTITNTYTIQMYIKATDWGKEWARIIDFSNGSSDDGIYFKNRPGSAERCIDLYPSGIIGACPFFNTSTYYLLTFTRNGQTDMLDVYVDKVLFASYHDVEKRYAGTAGVPIYIFRDDSKVTCESGEANFAYLAFQSRYFTKTDVDKIFSEVCSEASINPFADFSISPNPSCGFPKNIDVKYTGPIPAGSTEYTFKWDWDGGKVISGSGMGPYVINWGSGGTKNVSLIVTSKACGNSLFNRKQAIISNLNLATDVKAGSCDTGTDGTVTLTGSDGLAPYQYSIDSVNFQASNVFKVPAASYRVYVKDGNDCTVAKGINVLFNSDINVKTMPDTTVCEGQSVQLLTESNARTFAWLPQEGLDNASAREPVATPGSSSQYIITATKGFCTQTDTVLVNVAPKIEVNVTPDAVIEYNVPFQLIASSPQIRDFTKATFEWSPAIGLNNPFSPSPIAVLQEDQSYTVEILSEMGCVGTGQVRLAIKRQENIVVPAAFSPNGDGKNEVLVPLVNDIESISYFRIYNRWGQVVFFTDQLNTGWNGYFKGSEPMTGTYLWEIRGKSNKGKVITKSGSVLLLR